MASANSTNRILWLDERDNVAVALTDIRAGEQLACCGVSVRATGAIALGHKIALRPMVAGEKIIKYGASIGSATRAIAAGDHVHMHNLTSDYLPTYTRSGDSPFTENE